MTKIEKIELKKGDYEGEVRDGVPHGKGSIFYKNGKFKHGGEYNGEWKNGLEDGYGIISYYFGKDDEDFKDKDLNLDLNDLFNKLPGRGYWGEFKKGHFHGKGVLKDTINELSDNLGEARSLFDDKSEGLDSYSLGLYVGEFREGLRHGKGKFKVDLEHTNIFYDDTFVDNYDGLWKNGLPEGKGILINTEGSKYEGEFIKGKIHGHGTLYGRVTLNGAYIEGNEKYIGEFKHGVVEGHGTLSWDDGGKYVGEFKEGEMHGQGTMTSPDGVKLEGMWNEGEFVEVDESKKN